MVPRPLASTPCFRFLVVFAVVAACTPTVAAQYGYGGYYQDGGSGGSEGSGGPGTPEPTPTPQPSPTPTPTPTPAPEGQVSLSLTYIDAEGREAAFPADVLPGETVTVKLELRAIGSRSGMFRMSALTLDERLGQASPSRGSLSGSGAWSVTLQVGEEPGSYPLLFVAQDSSGTYKAVSIMGNVRIGLGAPLLMADGIPIRAATDSRELRAQNKSWWAALTLRNWTDSNWFANLCDDLYRDRGLLDTIAAAVRIDRDRLNITHTMPPIETYKSYANMEAVMSKYWAETGIHLSSVTANEIGNVMLQWRSSSGLVIDTSDDVMRILKIRTPTIKIGNVLNGVGAAMILLDFWSNMSLAGSPAESREAWNKAGYASLDLYLQNVVANTFGAAAALPGMFVSFVLNDSYNTLITGHKECWFKKMVEQAVDADYLSDDIKDTRAVDRVKSAMLSRKGLEGTLDAWWLQEAETWSGMMVGGCGNWNLAEARGYRPMFVERIMRTAEVEVNGKKYHPWSFYYSVSRMIAIEKQKELARETATKLRDIEAAYISTLQKKQYQGTFRVISAENPDLAFNGAQARPLEWEGASWWVTDEDGYFVAQVNGHNFSPNGDILLHVKADGRLFAFVVSRSAFSEVRQ